MIFMQSKERLRNIRPYGIHCQEKVFETSPLPPTYSKSVVRTMIFACIFECTILLIYLFADSCKNHLPYIPIPRKSVVRTMFPIYPDDYMKLPFQLLLKAIFLTSRLP